MAIWNERNKQPLGWIGQWSFKLWTRQDCTTEDPFDIERFQRVREIAAEMLAYKTALPVETVRDIFCCETGYQTPKLDTRAAVFWDGKILFSRA